GRRAVLAQAVLADPGLAFAGESRAVADPRASDYVCFLASHGIQSVETLLSGGGLEDPADPRPVAAHRERQPGKAAELDDPAYAGQRPDRRHHRSGEADVEQAGHRTCDPIGSLC